MPAIPPLPDTERRTQYLGLTGDAGPFNVGFNIYADGNDYANWLEVWLNGVKLTSGADYTVSSPSGSLSALARPITDARVTPAGAYAAGFTGVLQIVGARRPRRTSQFTEGVGIPARVHNYTYTDILAIAREAFDQMKRVPQVPPGETMAALPKEADRQNRYAKFDANGNLAPGQTVATIENAAVDAAASAAEAANQAGIATTQAGISTTQAGIATAQANTATTQAGIATTKAAEAAAYAAQAAANSENPAFSYKWNTNTGASDPGATYVKGDNAALASIGTIYISETALEGPIGSFLTAMMASTSPVKATLVLMKPGAETNWVALDVTSHVDSGAYRTLTCTNIGANGAFAMDDLVAAYLVRTGNQGAGDLSSAQNLNDVANKKTARDNISVKGADVAAATTLDLESATGYLIDVTGNTQIDAVTLGEGHERWVRFTGTPQLTNGASLVVQGGTRAMAAGDFVHFKGYAGGVVRATVFPASGKPVVNPTRAELGAAGTAQTDFISGIIKTGANQDYRIIERFPYAATITKIYAKTASGTITLTPKINATAITNGAINVTSTQSSATPSANNVAAAGDALVITGSSNSSATDISFVIEYTRTLS